MTDDRAAPATEPGVEPARREPAPPGTGLHRVASFLWTVLVLLVVLLALYVSAGRYAVSQLGTARGPLLAELNDRLPFNITMDSLSGGWRAFSPRVNFEGLALTPRDGASPLAVARGQLLFDVPASLLGHGLQFSELEVSGLSLSARLTRDGGIEIEGFEQRDGGALGPWLETFLPRVRRLTLLDTDLLLHSQSGTRRLTADVSLTRAGNERQLSARVSGDGLRLESHASGTGNPLRPLSWTGDIFLDFASEDLAGLSTLWANLDWPFTLAGSARAQLWLTRRDGDSTARMRLDGDDVRLEERDGGWSLPMDVLAFEAALSQQGDFWALLTEDLHLERGERNLDLDRAQFEWRRDSLRIRADELSLDALPNLLGAAPGIPAGLREALPALSPGGRLHDIELRLDDLAAPGESWSLRALLDDVSVESWRRAPGVSGLSGFLTLRPGGGALQLDSTQLAMTFPSVYREPLAYDALWGHLRLAWDDASLHIDSGLLRAVGPEGEVHALVAVDLPFSERVTGPEMELLAGLADSAAVHRRKYIPYRLPQPLLDWLDGSVEGGRVRRAGFIWRGSLLAGNREHMTVQLFLDTQDGRLRFDPAWPTLEDLDALVRVDDGRTWGLASRGRIYDTDVAGLRVAVLPKAGGADLFVRGGLEGDAADGHRLLKESPLAELTRGVFADWQLAGPVAGDLTLGIELGENAAPPRVKLSLALEDVAARIAPVDLPLATLRGELRYSSEEGFAGSTATGTLWGKALSLEALPAGPAGLELEIAGVLDGGRLAGWLEQPLLGFIEGEVEVAGTLAYGENRPAELALASSLEGLTLDAPAPFTKSEQQALPTEMTLALAAQPRMRLAVGERLSLALDFERGGLRQLLARVGRGEVQSCDARFCLSGELSTLDLAAWRDFALRYMDDEAAAVPAVEADVAPPTIRVESLTVGDLRFGDRRLGASRLDLWGRGALWQGAVESPVVQGALTREGGELKLLLEYLDLDAFGGGEPLTLDSLRASLPSMHVDILDLRRGGERLGVLGFDLDSGQPDGALYASAITGELWGLRLADPSPGLLSWYPDGDATASAIELDVAFDDLGESLARLGYARSLESDRGRATLRLRWPGAPLDYAAKTMAGEVTLALRDGKFFENRPGALAMVSLLNFAEILRALSLSHMFETGIPFETADARFVLGDGRLRVPELEIDGAASAFAFKGVSDLRQGEVDGELIVTLPVANNLPWVAALAGGPAVAAGVFVVSKVFEKQVNRMSSAVYGVSGPIADPEVKFRRLFDDAPSRAAERAADAAVGSESDAQDPQVSPALRPEDP